MLRKHDKYIGLHIKVSEALSLWHKGYLEELHCQTEVTSWAREI